MDLANSDTRKSFSNKIFRWIISAGLFIFAVPALSVTPNDPACTLRHYLDGTSKEINLAPFVHQDRSGINSYGAYFDTSILKNTKKTRKMLLSPMPKSFGTVSIGATHTKTMYGKKIKIPYTFIDRNSSKLLVVGGGYTDARDMYAPLAVMFPNYDIVFFDYRGHGMDQGSLFYKCFGANVFRTRFGSAEHEEVFAIVDEIKNRKVSINQHGYEKVFGMGFCFSAVTFAHAETLKPETFDKLVLECPWISQKIVLRRVFGKVDVSKEVLSRQARYRILRGFVRTLSLFGITKHKIVRYLCTRSGYKKLNCHEIMRGLTDKPILFFHGTNDFIVPNEEFEKVWELAHGPEHYAITTPSRHTLTRIKYKELFKLAADLFFEGTKDDIVNGLQSEDELERISSTMKSLGTNKETVERFSYDDLVHGKFAQAA